MDNVNRSLMVRTWTVQGCPMPEDVMAWREFCIAMEELIFASAKDCERFLTGD